MNAANLVSPKSNPFERLFDRVIDPARSDRALALLLCGYAVVWWLYAVISKGSQDIHIDMGEIVAWSREVTLGTPKHPPLAAWLVRGWFSVLPADTWAYYLFAVISATIALWIAWRISARYLSPEKRVVAIVMLTFVPFFNFHAIKFNANSVLISPVVAIVAHRTGVRAYAGHYRLIAGAVESAWHAQTSQPLRIVGSTYTVVNGIVFYIADQPSIFDITSSAETTGIDEGRIKREGIAIVCPERETSCMTAMKEYEVRYPAAKGAGVSLARHHFGVLDRPVKYMILIVPPESP